MSIARQHAEWLSLLEISGPFLSMPVLLRPGVFPHGLDDHDPEVARNLRRAHEEWADNQQGLRPDPAIHTAWVRFVLREVLGYTDDLLLSGPAIPEAIKATIAEHGETLRPDLVIQREGHKPRILIQSVPPAQDLDKTLKDHRWKASPATRMADLLRATGVRLGIVTNGERWMLVHAQAGETASYISWYASLWLEERLTLQAFRSLLSIDRTFGVKDSDTLEALFSESASNQQEVTDQLGYQVRQAVEVLVQTLDRIDKDRGRTLLAGVSETMLYEAALTVMMRLVFLFSAEERELLLLGKPMYDEHYAVSTLRAQLRDAADQTGEEVLERRFDAWSRLLATFRAVFGGVQHEDLRLPAYGGNLFDPDRFPFLEGRAVGTTWREMAARPLPVDNRTVLHLLEALQILRIAVPGGGPAEPRRLSFRALDIEQIGHVYEGLLDHTAKRAAEPILGLTGTKDREPEVALSELERRAFGTKHKAPTPHMLDMFAENGAATVPLRENKELIEFLAEQTGRSASALANALSRSLDAHALDELRVACDNDAALFERVKPFAGLLRGDTFDRPVVITAGSVYVTAGTDRRSSGTHYTPRSLTEPIVQHTLDPLVYHGPAEGLAKEQWKLHSAEHILSLKVCDMAMGSGAFLVQTCRYLSERLVEAVESQTPSGGPNRQLNELFELHDPDERLAYARRLVADRCLYGVDKNPLAVEKAKLSLWLITLQKDRPFSFLDHALRCGDSLLGIASIDQLRNWSLDRNAVTNLNFLNDPVRRALERALQLRRQILATTVLDVRQAEEKARLLHEAEQAMELVRLAADLLVATALYPKPKQREEKQREFQWRLQILDDAADLIAEGRFTEHGSAPARESFTQLRQEANILLGGRKPFHWLLEFPEVFSEEAEIQFSEEETVGLEGVLKTVKVDNLTVETVSIPMNGGFTAVVGNPPFVGGRRIRETLGDDYRDALYELYPGSSGNADLSAFFFLRGYFNLRHGASLGLIATNTIVQGDTRETGIDKIIADGGIIYNATNSRPWPGIAAVIVSIIHIAKHAEGLRKTLDGVDVEHISNLLEGRVTRGNPYCLMDNTEKSYQGSLLRGMGFIITAKEANELIQSSPRNSEVILPYLNGEDLNTNFDQSPTRWVINFFDWPLDIAQTYEEPMQILMERVYSERMSSPENMKIYEKMWWQFWRPRIELQDAIRNLSRVLVRPRVSNTHAPVFVPKDWIYSEAIVVFTFEDNANFALLQSVLHECWIRQYASTLKGDTRYSPSDVFDTFPFPTSLEPLEAIGEIYHEYRRQIMLARQEGLTKTYNRFHNPDDDNDDISELRKLHAEMDQAVAAAYGWIDLDLEHGFHQTKQGQRYTISENMRRTLLDRLLVLNHQCNAQEDAHLILMTRIIQRHRAYGSQNFAKTLGRVKAEKIAHIIEAHFGVDLGRAPVRDAAGPVDFAHLLSIIGRGKSLGVFQERRRSSSKSKNGDLWQSFLGDEHVEKGYEFIPLSNFEQTANRMSDVFGKLSSQIDALIDTFIGLNTDESEIVATLYAAWNDILADGEDVTDERLFRVFYDWDKSKHRFQDGELRRMKAWMQALQLIPNGTAKRTKPLPHSQTQPVSICAPVSAEQEEHYAKLKALLKEEVVITVKMTQDRLKIEKRNAQSLLNRLVDDGLARQERGPDGLRYRQT